MNRESFEASLQKPLSFWSGKSAAQAGTLLGKDTAKMIGFDQHNPHHCFDLMMHTLHTLDHLGKEAPELLKAAAFFHDIGKPSSAFEKQGRLVFYGHAKKSAQIARPVLEKLGYSKDEIDEICFYIAHHDDFISWILPNEKASHPSMIEINEANLKKHIKKYDQQVQEHAFRPQKKHWQNLLRLSLADASAQAEQVIWNGKIIDTKAHKQKKVNMLQNLLEETDI